MSRSEIGSRSGVAAMKTPPMQAMNEVRMQHDRPAPVLTNKEVPVQKTQEKVVRHENPKTPSRMRDDEERPEFLRSKSKRDNDNWQNPTFQSQILNERRNEQKVQTRGWETTTRTAFELPISLQKEVTDSSRREIEQTADDKAYKAWRRQTTEPLQSPKKYGNTEQLQQEVPSPHRKKTKQPEPELKDHYYQPIGHEVTDHARDLMYRYRKDDQIFPHDVNYEGDHNEIIHEQSAKKLYAENPVYRQINDDRIGYTKDSMRRDIANEILAAEKHNRQSAEKMQVLSEEQNQLRRAAELEDRNERDNERRRDYR